MPLTYLWLFPLGLAIGAFGTLIGAGGGFILVPILLIVYPNENTELITSISLAVVFFNALSGSVAYARMKRIDYKSGIIFAVATIPGAILGAVSTAYVPRYAFDIIFGVLMIVAGAFLWLSAKDDHKQAHASPASGANGREAGALDRARIGRCRRRSLSLRLQSGGWHRAQYIRRLYFEPLGGRRRLHPCPGTEPLVEFPGAYRHRHVALRLGGHGLDRNVGAHRQRRFRARRAQDRDTGGGRRPRSASRARACPTGSAANGSSAA